MHLYIINTSVLIVYLLILDYATFGDNVADAIVNIVLVDLTEYAKQHSDKAVKKTLSSPMWPNTLCEEKIINFSKILQDQ